jgi:hypothetical protein
MNMQQNRWMPLVAGIGIGAAAASMMRGQGGQLKKIIPQFANMTGATGLANMANQGQNVTQQQNSQSDNQYQ